jgi:uncharacterized membrane protein YkoI
MGRQRRRGAKTEPMNTQSIRLVLMGVLLAVLASLPVAAHAGHGAPGMEMQTFAPSTTAQRPRLSLEQAADAVARATGGRILDAKAVGNEYRIKVLTKRGEVRVVYVNADTGAMRE